MKTYKKSGYIKSKHGKIWYKILGNKGVPIIAVNGGPGSSYDYLKPLEELAKRNKIIFYDSLGCGKSDPLRDKSLWSLGYFVNELEEVINHLSLTTYYILGHSWGVAVAVSFVSKKTSKRAKAIILSEPFLSAKIWERDANKLIKKLPKHMQNAINAYKTSNKETVAYKKAAKEYYKRFVYRMDSLPYSIKKSKFNKRIYEYMWGPKEYLATGTLKRLDLTKSLKKIRIPALLLCGKYDEATPQATKYFKNLLPNSEMKVFRNSAHFPFYTDKKEYLATILDFINRQN